MAQQRIEATKSAAQTIEMEVESDDEMKSDDEAQSAADAANEEANRPQNPKPKFPSEVLQPIPAAPNPENVVIRKDYNPKSKQVKIL